MGEVVADSCLEEYFEGLLGQVAVSSDVGLLLGSVSRTHNICAADQHGHTQRVAVRARGRGCG